MCYLMMCSPQSGRDPVAEEINLMKNMLVAVVEERYTDAGIYFIKNKCIARLS